MMYTIKIMLLITVVAILTRLMIVVAVPFNNSNVFELTIVHLNDFHARYEQISNISGTCKARTENCIGGFSRIYTTIKHLVKNRPDSIVLNGGDNFQGTLWYSVYKWNVTQYFLNLLPFDAYTLGNHEFDHGIKGLVPFLTALEAPVVVANLDDQEEPNIQGLYNKSAVIERNGKRIGIIGVISKHTHQLSNTGKLKFLDESSFVNREAQRLVANEGVDTIIVLSHCGYETDQILAKNAGPKIGLIVGAHSHTFLYTGFPLPGLEKPKGPYPTVITHNDGRNVLIVQASALSKYVGNLTVLYDNEGNAISWSGAPIYLNNSIKQDEEINNKLEVWKKGLEAQGRKILGHTNVLLKHSNCRYAECNLGNFITDSMVSNYLNTQDDAAWTSAAIAVINSGGIKTSIVPGNVTYSDLILTLPFGNTFDVCEIQGIYLKAALEFAARSEHHWGGYNMNLLQVSGLHIVYNTTKPLGSRVVSIEVRCRKCQVPLYEELDLDKYYKIVINSFLANGGEGHTILADHIINRKIGIIDTEVLEQYIKKRSPITQEEGGRIRIIH